MMHSIEKVGTIRIEKLRAESYFESLLTEACAANLLGEQDVERIQYECLTLLADKTKRYNGMDSSSIRVETARDIMVSNLFTVGLWLKTYASPDDAAAALKETSIAELYQKGRKRIDTMVASAKTVHARLLANLLDVPNAYYRETIDGGIKGFFKLYQPDFRAQEIHITADYPVYNPMPALDGIEFIQRYLQAAYYENAFCVQFHPEDVHHLLCGYDERYPELLINLYEPVLAAAVGCVLAGTDARRLDITQEGIARLTRLFAQDGSVVQAAVFDTFDTLTHTFQIAGGLERYMRNSLPGLLAAMQTAAKTQTLDKVFLIPKYPQQRPRIDIAYGDKMDDGQYREIVRELAQCRFLDDKLAIIKTRIRSLADLEDILLDAEWSPQELTTVLRETGLPELVALTKDYPYKPDVDAQERRPQEQLLAQCLHDYAATLPTEVRRRFALLVESADVCRGEG